VTFVHPLLAWGALASLIPLILHLIDRRRSRPHPFAAFDFLLRARLSSARHLRLRRLLLLLLRMALLAAIPLALARPQARSQRQLSAAAAHGPSATILLLDASGSMGYRRGSTTLFGRAQELADGRLSDLSAEESVSVQVCAHRRPPPAAPSLDHGAGRAAIDAARVSQEPVDLNACLAVAMQTLAESPLPSRRIVVFTDLTAADWNLSATAAEAAPGAHAERPDIEVVDVSDAAMPNQSVGDLVIEPAPAIGPRAYQFSFVVRNFADHPVQNLPVSLRSDGKTLARGFCDLPAHGVQRKVLAASFSPGTIVQGDVALPEDGLPEDDRVTFVLKIPREVHALLVDGAPSTIRFKDEAYFMETALEAGASPVTLRTVDLDSLSERDLVGTDVVALLNVRALSKDFVAALAGFVRAGGGLFIALGDRVEPDSFNQTLGTLLPADLHLVRTAAASPEEGAIAEPAGLPGQAPAHFSHIDFASPIFSVFGGGSREGLTDVRVFRYYLLQPPHGPMRILASYDDGTPALVTASRGAGTVVLFTSSVGPEWSDWPIHPSFVPAMQQMVRSLSGAFQESSGVATVVGEPHRIPSTPDEVPATAISPSGKELALERQPDGAFTLPAPPEVGLYRVGVRRGSEARSVESSSLSFPVIFSGVESDTQRLERRELYARLGSGPRAPGETPSTATQSSPIPLWTSLLGLGALTFLLEGLLLLA
jgi:Aerotolerance regulator N-terminal